jgi:hypothetical protein
MSTTQFHYTSKALSAICDERERQLEKWGVQNLDPLQWLAILGEEHGEACEAALALAAPYLHDPSGEYDLPVAKLKAKYRRELVQVAAVAVAMIECLDRAEPQR